MLGLGRLVEFVFGRRRRRRNYTRASWKSQSYTLPDARYPSAPLHLSQLISGPQSALKLVLISFCS